MTLGELVKKIRVARNMTQKGLGNRVGVTNTRICKIESDSNDSVGIRLIERIATQGFRMSPLEFFTHLYSEDTRG